MLGGGAGDDTLWGGTGADRLDGAGGDDVLTGASDRTFVFEENHGNDTITDFTNGRDLIDLGAFGLSGFAALTTSFNQDGVTIDLTAHDGGTLLLEGLDMADLDATGFTL